MSVKQAAAPARTPLSFARNVGQDASGAPYLAQGPGYAMKLFPDRVQVAVGSSCGKAKSRLKPAEMAETKACQSSSLRLDFKGANTKAAIETANLLPGVENYFISADQSRWRTGLPTYGLLTYHEIYPGIDLAFHGNEGRLEYDFAVSPHAEVSKIAIALKEAEHAELDEHGDLVVTVGGREMRFLKPVAWQGEKRTPVEVAYELTPATKNAPAVITFKAGAYDHAQSLVIDPVLSYATYLPLYTESAITVDGSGNVYVTGQDPTQNVYAIDVLKYSAAGALLYTDVIQPGDSRASYGYSAAIAVDGSGDAYIAGFAGPGWPTTSTAYQTTNAYSNAYNYNAYLVKLNPAGTSMSYASYLGGTTAPSYHTDYAVGLALDGSGDVYLTGIANSTNFPTTSGAFQTKYPTNNGSAASFVAKFNPAQSGVNSLVYSTLLGDATTTAAGIAVDASGDAYFYGNNSNQYNSTLASTPGSFAYSGLNSGYGAGAYVIKLNPAGSGLIYSAYLGPSNTFSIAVDTSGDAYVTGQVTQEDFPTTNGAYQTSYPGGVVSELNPAGSALVYSTFLSGPSGATSMSALTPRSIAITPGCNSACAAYVAGLTTTSGTADLPQINSIQTVATGPYYGFLAALNGTGSAATLSTYMGGIASSTSVPPVNYYGYIEGTPSVTVDPSGNVYYAANINTADFPVTTATAPVSSGYYPYLAKISPASGALVAAVPTTINLGNTVVGTSSAVYNSTTPTVTLRNEGSAPVTITSITGNPAIFTQTNTCGGTIAAGGQCTLSPAFTPASSGSVSGTLSIASNGNGSPLTINLSGTSSDYGYLQISTTSLNFGTQTVGTTSGFQTITLKNTGDKSITSLSFSPPAGFNTLNDCPATLTAGSSCQVGLQFAPYQAGYYNTQAYLSMSGGYGSAYIYFTGTGVVSGDTGQLTLNASALNFNTLADGTTSATQYVTLKNSGAVPLTVNPYTTKLTSTAGTAPDFAISPYSCGAPSFAMLPNASCSFSVTFTPSAVGTETATISVPNSTGTTQTVAVSGTGVADTQSLIFTPSNYVYPDQTVGTTGTANTFYIANNGDFPIPIDRVYASGDFLLQSQGCAGRTLAPDPHPGVVGAYCTVSVAFRPSTAGNRSGSLTFVDSAGAMQTLTLTGNGVAAYGSLVNDPAAIVFPAQAVGTTSATQSFTGTNQGNVPVTINSIGITGDYTYTLSDYCGTTLPCAIPPGYTYTVKVAFTPSSTANPRTGAVTVNSTAGTQTVALTGTGETASLAVALTPAAGSTLNFGSVKSGSNSTVQVYLRNVGTEPVSIPSNPTISGNYSVSSSCPSTLQPGSDCQIRVYFSPSGTGTQTGVLTVTSSASPQTLNLTGTGTAAAPTTYFNTPELTWPETGVGLQASPTTQYFYWNGTGSLTIASAQVTAGGSAFSIPFLQDNCSGITINSGGYCYFQVVFAPTAAGYLTGTVTLTDTSGNAYTFPLAAYAPTVVDSGYLSPDGLAFTSQTVGTTSSQQIIYLTNTGSTSMSVGSIGGTNVGPGTEFTLVGGDYCSNTTLPPTSSNNCYFYVRFAPTAAGTRTGQVSIPVTYSDNTTATFTANLTGTGAAAQNKALLTPTTTQFPDTTIGTSQGSSWNQSFVLSNVGTLPFIVDQLSGTNTIIGTTSRGDYTSSDGCSGVNLAPGRSCTVTVYFSPLAGPAGARAGALNVPVTYSGASSVTMFTATYSGNALAASTALLATPSSLQLGTYIVGTTSPYATISLSNNSNALVHLKTPTIGAPFALQNSCGATLASGSSCNIYVYFRPSTTGVANGTLSIASDAAGSPLTVSVTGTGLAANQQLVFSQSAVAFGSQVVSTTSKQVTLNLLNQSSANVPIKSITLGGTNVADFTVVSDGCTGRTLSGQQSCPIVLEFTPGSSSTGSRTATVTENDNGTGGPRSVSLSGTGIDPTPTVGLFPSSLTFQPQNIGTTSGAQTFSVTNTGSASLTISSVASTGSSEFAVSYNACNGVSLAAPTSSSPGGQCLVTVTWKPVAGGTHNGTISVTDNGTGSPQTLPLTGLVPQAAASPTSLTFSSQNVGSSSAAQTVTLSNSGTGTLSIASIALGGANASDYSASNNCGSGLAAGASCTISVTFAPTAGGSRTATLTVTDNAALVAGSTQTVSLSGTGVPVATAPTFSPAPGTYIATQSVTLSDTTTGATIYYTTNGTTPTTSSTKYAGAITVSANETIEAIAVASGYAQSPVATGVYTITPPAATPTFTPAAGTYTTTQSVTIADATGGATIYYTTNGTTPTTSSTKYTGAITVSATETIEAIALAPGDSQSATATAVYTITRPAATPTFTPAAGTYTGTQSITLADTTTGATIYYTTNGTTPTTSSTKYTAAITVSTSETIEAIAVASGYSQSATATAAYTIH